MSGTCVACGQAADLRARFCSSCGARLGTACPSCGAAADPDQRFCAGCGTALRPVSPGAQSQDSAGERKQVTVLFADVARSMDLTAAMDPDEWADIADGLLDVCREAVEYFGGTIDKFTGDGVMALFGAPVAQEDHARRACHTAIRLLRSAEEYARTLRSRGIELRVRVGLNSGEVVAGPRGGAAYTAVGHTVGLAQRMESIATPGTACLTADTAALVGTAFQLLPLGPMEVKGGAAPVHAFALVSVSGGRDTHRPSGSVRLVGREREMYALEAALAEAAQGQACVLGLVGEAGAGKSRLCAEFTRRAEALGATVLRTAGVSHARTVPLLPVLGLFRDRFDISDDESAESARDRVTARLEALGVDAGDDLDLVLDFLEIADPDRPVPHFGPEGRRRRILDVVRRMTSRRSEQETVLLLLEDLHWFDPASAAFLEAWLPSFPGTRTIVVTNFRPEFRADWMAASYYQQIPLAPLRGDAYDELLTELLGPDPSLAPLATQLRERAGGNPFFTEEIVRGLAADGSLSGATGAYRLADPVAPVRLPPTVQAVLAQRIDRLAAREKDVLRAASVIGRIFDEKVLAAAAGLGSDEVADVLSTLAQHELVLRDEGGGHRFWHPLTQEVAYRGLVAPSRRRLHAAVAQALVGAGPKRLEEQAALIATHYEAAADAWEAARWQIRAGTRAMRADYAEAQRRWRSALDHLDQVPESVEARALGVRARTLLLRLGARTGMDVVETERLAARAWPEAERLGDPVLLSTLALADYVVKMWSGDVRGALLARLPARRYADESRDPAMRAWIATATAWVEAYGGSIPDGLQCSRLAIDLCGDDPTLGTAHAGYSAHDLAHYGLLVCLVPGGGLAEARLVVRRALACFEERPSSEWQSATLATVAQIAYFSGDRAEAAHARRCAEQALHVARDSGNNFTSVRATYGIGLIELLDMQPGAALQSFGEALAEARRQRCGLMEEAAILAHQALAQLELGDAVGARATADEAVEVAVRQGARVVEALAQLTQAHVLRRTACSTGDLAAAAQAIAAGEAAAAETGAATHVASLAEERARLAGSSAGLAAAVEGYTSIGAAGHARRLREELNRSARA